MSARALARLRRLCLAFPSAYEKEAWGSATFRVEKGKIFAMSATAAQPNGKGRLQVWLNADKVNQELLVSMRPTRYFVPPYVGPSGWIGAWLDGVEDWDEVRELLNDAWRRAAPKAVLKAVELGASAKAPASAPGAATSKAVKKTAKKTARRTVKQPAKKTAKKTAKAAARKPSPRTRRPRA